MLYFVEGQNLLKSGSDTPSCWLRVLFKWVEISGAAARSISSVLSGAFFDW